MTCGLTKTVKKDRRFASSVWRSVLCERGACMRSSVLFAGCVTGQGLPSVALPPTCAVLLRACVISCYLQMFLDHALRKECQELPAMKDLEASELQELARLWKAFTLKAPTRWTLTEDVLC